MSGTDDLSDGLQDNAACQTLLRETRQGRLPPGDRLRETELAALTFSPISGPLRTGVFDL